MALTGNEIRGKFLDYFGRRDHEIVRSGSLVPAGDATLLFANAGMNQFKNVFLGREARKNRRAVSSQKCLRVSGKHNDFEQVGRTARHHTFFEMLGNFSFGDYFKKDAIAYAWDLVTDEFGLPRERLWATVFREDDEAAALWKDISGLPSERIVRMGEADNFWAMGDTGPCGPCSEIYYDQGPAVGCGRAACDLGCGCDRYLEFWNLVFMQFDRSADGTMKPLDAPCIDTGAGLERLAAILQGVDSNYRSDLFVPLIEAVATRARRTYGEDSASDVALQVIADHLRAMTFLVSDGVVPSNEKRGYVLRRIIRRALTYGLNIGLEPPYLHELTGTVSRMMGEAYPELQRNRDRIAEICRREEEAFESSLARGLEEAGAVFARYRGGTVPAEQVVKLWTTYGVTLEIQEVLAQKSGVAMPEAAAVEVEMEKHREAAKASWKGAEAPAIPRYLLDLASGPGWEPCRFTGYETLVEPSARIVALADSVGAVDRLEEGIRGFVVLDRTSFYAESGGQVGDTGQLKAADGSEAEVDDTQCPVPGVIVHFVTILNGSLERGDLVRASVNGHARAATMRNHTGTHLLHAALKRILGDSVQQGGSYVGPDRLRFDFNFPRAVTREELDAIEEDVNEQILRNVRVTKEQRGFEEAMTEGAIALFGEKYGDLVRVVTVPGYSKELCGGTHCEGTGDIGSLRIVSEKGIAAGVRRIEALTGMGAVRRSREDSRLLSSVEEVLRTPRDGVHEAIVNTLALQKSRTREIEKLKLKLARLEVASGGGGAPREPVERIDGVAIVARSVEGLDRPAMRTLADNMKREAGTSVVILASETEGKVSLLASISDDLEGRLDARNIIKELAAIVGGGGGGNPTLAEAGGRAPEKIPEMLSRAREIVSRLLAAAPTRKG